MLEEIAQTASLLLHVEVANSSLYFRAATQRANRMVVSSYLKSRVVAIFSCGYASRKHGVCLFLSKWRVVAKFSCGTRSIILPIGSYH
jgi:hypothetical protein